MNTAINDAQASISGIIDLIGRFLVIVQAVCLFVRFIKSIVAIYCTLSAGQTSHSSRGKRRLGTLNLDR